MSIYENFEPINFDAIKTYDLASRPSKVSVKDFAEPVTDTDSLKNFLKKLPKILAAESLKEIAKQIRRARDSGKPIIWGIGGHVIKTGLAPVLIDLMRHGFVSAIASNGSVLVHDTEIALVGFTSEDVDTSLGKGDFGAARECAVHRLCRRSILSSRENESTDCRGGNFGSDNANSRNGRKNLATFLQ
jgi:hypothetical protein